MDLLKISMMKQPNMRVALKAMIPLFIAGIYLFGWRVLALLLVNLVFGTLTEYMFKRKKGQKVSEAVFVSAALYTLILPPATPFWVSAVGIIFGIVFAKEAFGGFGRNVFNPALVSRAFVYVSFPAALTGSWTEVAKGFPGGFVKYLHPAIDTVATATPLHTYQSSMQLSDNLRLFLGNVPGSIGETSKVLIILALIYMLYKKVIQKEGMIGMFLGFSIATFLFRQFGVESVVPLPMGLISGGFLFAMTFMMTDPITQPRTKEGKYFIGALVGAITLIIRSFALFPGGVMFAILIGNSFTPIVDEAVNGLKRRKKERSAQ